MDIVKKATREGYGDALVKWADEFPDMVVLDADLAGSTKTGQFKKAHPERFVDCGVAEADMTGIAAGLATTGKIPVISSFAVFATGRNYDQIRNSVAYPRLNVKIGGTHAGVTVGEDGASHQALEDIALMRALPGMTVISPADYAESIVAVKAALEHNGPVYMRFGRAAVPVVTDKLPGYKFELGKGSIIKEGKDVSIFATGILVAAAIDAAEMLKDAGIDAEIINIATIKPLDRELVVNSARKTGMVVTAEEHSIIGGLGSAVCEALSEDAPTKVYRIGVRDEFGESGSAGDLIKKYGFDGQGVYETVRKFLGK
jgi:transketolase